MTHIENEVIWRSLSQKIVVNVVVVCGLTLLSLCHVTLWYRGGQGIGGGDRLSTFRPKGRYQCAPLAKFSTDSRKILKHHFELKNLDISGYELIKNKRIYLLCYNC